MICSSIWLVGSGFVRPVSRWSAQTRKLIIDFHFLPLVRDHANVFRRAEEGRIDHDSGHLAAPGTYSVTMALRSMGEVRELGSESFEVVPLRDGTLPSASPEEVVAFLKEVDKSSRVISGLRAILGETGERLDAIEAAVARSTTADFDAEVEAMQRRLYDMRDAMSGSQQQDRVSELKEHSIGNWMMAASMGTSMSTYGPTPTHRRSLDIAQELLEQMRGDIAQLVEVDIPALEERLEAAGVAWTTGRKVPQ